MKILKREYWASIAQAFRTGAAEGRAGRAGRSPWGVAAPVAADGRVCQRRLVYWRIHWWYAWCDCGWNRTARTRRTAATLRANHQHLSPEMRRSC